MTASAPGDDVVTVCPNIGPSERRKRLLGGIVGTVLTALAVGLVLSLHLAWWWRLLVALPAGLGAIGFFQAQAQTCVGFSQQNVRRLGDGPAETVTERWMQAAIARQSRAVYLKTVLTTAAVVALTLLLP